MFLGSFKKYLILLGGISIINVLYPAKNYIDNGSIKKVFFYAAKSYNSSEKIKRRGYLVKRKNAPATIVICHGYMCDKNDISFLRFLFDKYNSLVFDFRAQGEDAKGQLCTFGYDEALDILGAVELLKSDKSIKEKPIIGYGFSMGAVALITAQSKNPGLFHALILDCPFDSSDNMVKRAVDNLNFQLLGYKVNLPGRYFLKKYAYNYYVQYLLKWFLKTIAGSNYKEINTFVPQMDITKEIKKVNEPCFFIGCKNDEKIPEEAILNIYKGANGFKRLWITNGRNHFDSFFYNPEKYFYKVNSFLNKILSGRFKQKLQDKILVDK